MNAELNKVFYSFLSNWSPVEGVVMSEMMSDLNDLISAERHEARKEALEEALVVANEAESPGDIIENLRALK